MFDTLLYISSVLLIVIALEDPYNNDLSILDIIRNRGYPVELYSNLTTEDNYLLDIQRIPHGIKNANVKMKRQPILMMPPLLTSGEAYIINNNSIVYHLSEAGYDIWLANPRGSIYSRKHLLFNVSSNSPYWLYSWHEKGYYDLATFIDFVLEKTGYDKIILFGYSEGTTDTFVLLSDRSEYNDKIKLAVMLAPIVYLSHTGDQLLKSLAYQVQSLKSALFRLGIRGIILNFNELYKLKRYGTEVESVENFCLSVLDVAVQYKQSESSVPACYLLNVGLHGASFNEATHYAQSITSRDFRHYDYGPDMNKIRYDTKRPPRYNLKNVVVPVAIFYSVDDLFTQEPDVNRLVSKLQNLVHLKKIVGKNFTHYHFLSRKDAHKVLYKHVLEFIVNFK